MSATASLADLLNGQSLSLGGVTLDNFGAIETALANGGTVSPVDPATVGVLFELTCDRIELTFGDSSGGLGGFIASASNGGTYDYLLNFDVYTPDGISSASLSQLAGGAGPSFANITESISFLDLNGNPTGVGLNTDENFTSDSTVLPGSPAHVSVAKDILLQSFGGSSAQISQFSQSYYLVPEPSSISLVGVGLLSLLSLRRRR